MTGYNGGDGANVSVEKNGTILFSGFVPANDTSVGKSWSLVVVVAPGDTIDTIVNRNGNYYGDEQVLTQVIGYQPLAYNSATDFSSSQGAKQWRYLDGNGNAMVFDGTYLGASWHSTTPANGDWCYISATQQHPGNSASAVDSTRRWTAPYAGRIRVDGYAHMTGPNGGDGANVYVKHNGTTVSSVFVGPSNTVGSTWYLNLSVALGDTVDLVVNRNGNYYGDEQAVGQSIYYSGDAPVTVGVSGVIEDNWCALGPDYDFALIRLDTPQSRQFAGLGASSAVGQLVYPMGNPGASGQTITQGVVTSVYDELVTMELADINGGHSGGPIVNPEGGLLGVIEASGTVNGVCAADYVPFSALMKSEVIAGEFSARLVAADLF